MSYVKSTPNRPKKSDCKHKTHQEAGDRWTCQRLPQEDMDREEWTQATGQQLHDHLAQRPKDGPKAQLHRGPQPLHLLRDGPVTTESPAPTFHPELAGKGNPDWSSVMRLGLGEVCQ